MRASPTCDAIVIAIASCLARSEFWWQARTQVCFGASNSRTQRTDSLGCPSNTGFYTWKSVPAVSAYNKVKKNTSTRCNCEWTASPTACNLRLSNLNFHQERKTPEPLHSCCRFQCTPSLSLSMHIQQNLRTPHIFFVKLPPPYLLCSRKLCTPSDTYYCTWKQPSTLTVKTCRDCVHRSACTQFPRQLYPHSTIPQQHYTISIAVLCLTTCAVTTVIVPHWCTLRAAFNNLEVDTLESSSVAISRTPCHT